MLTIYNQEQTMQETLAKLKVMFQLSGLKLYSQTEGNKILYFINFFWLNTDMLATASWMFGGIYRGKSFTEISFSAPCFTFTAVAIFKAAYITFHNDKVHRILDDLMKVENKTRNSTISANLGGHKEIKYDEIKLLNMVIKFYIIMTGMMIFIFNAGPLLVTLLTYHSTGEVVMNLPFLDVYPYIDALDLKYWPFFYIHQFWSVCIALFEVCAVDCLLFVCSSYLRIQFRLIQLDIENIIPVRAVSKEKFQGDEDFRIKFTEVLSRHQVIIGLSNTLENIYSISIFFNFLTSSVVICFTGFNMMVIDDTTLVVTFVIFLVMSLLQIWCICYFGDLLMTSSGEVSDAVYASQWYLASGDISKKLLFLLTRAQSPCKLTAYGFVDVNLVAFMKILSKAWSYFALLKTIYVQ